MRQADSSWVRQLQRTVFVRVQPALNGRRFGNLNLPVDRFDRSLRLRQLDTEFEPSDGGKELIVPVGKTALKYRPRLCQHHQRQPEVCPEHLCHAVESSWRNTDHRIALTIERHRLTDNLWVAVEAALPELMAEHDDRVPARCALFLREKAAP